MKRTHWFVLIMLLVGCGGGETLPASTAVSTQPPTIEEEAAAEVVPTETAVPLQPTDTPVPPTPLRLETAVPPTNTATPQPPEVPELVWLPYATGNFGAPVLMLEDENMMPQLLPVEVEIFFAYQAGWLAYGSKFWGATANQQSVTDLHIYDFATGTDQLWDEANIGRAVLSPAAISGQPMIAVAKHNGRGFDLLVKLGPDTDLFLVEDVDPYFSWSPDGSQIAYLRDGELFVTSATGDSGNPAIASGVYTGSGWIGDAPLWLGDSDYLLYADAPFVIVAADGSETIVPTTGEGALLQGPRPFAMLYSSTTNQLVAESEGMFGASVVVYQLGEGFATAVITQQIDDAQLAGWYEENESVIIVSGGEPAILPLTPQE